VVQQIQEAILGGRFKTGDLLPPERELKTLFNTSRGTLREALRVLEHKGLIEVRLGVSGGSVVRAVGAAQVGESLALLIRTQSASLQELAEFRSGLEGDVAALAAERADRRQVGRLREIVAAARRCADVRPPDWEALLHADERFHQALAEASGNAVYRSVSLAIHDNIDPYYQRLLPKEPAYLQENIADLAAIAEAVAAGDAPAARARAREHVRRFQRHMQPATEKPTA
jgi:DNA-binding FadR family transcriptional regulator